MNRIPLALLLYLISLSRIAGAQTGATVSGLVTDSIARAPLAGAMVQLLAANNPADAGRTATSDSLGRYNIPNVPDGSYKLGFIHPMLDSIGIEAPLREVDIRGGRSVRADLAIPSPAKVRAAICGPRSLNDSTGVLIGSVHDARDGAPAANVTVVGEWLEYSFGPGGLNRRIPRLAAKTGDNGWFAMCNVPTSGTVTVIASRDADSTGHVEVQIPASGFARRELYLGTAQIVMVADTTKRTDSVPSPSPPRRMLVGNGRISGTVIAAVGGKPLGGAVIRITDGPQTRSNERGEWSISSAPVGTRTLEIRAIGYYPVLRHVDVVAGAAPVRIAMSTMRAVLDTVRISAARVYDRHMSGFETRRKSSLGRYLTAADVMRHRPIVTSDLFRRIPGMYLERGALGETQITVRGMVSDRCTPAVYIDDHYMRNLSAEDIDDYVRPENIMGIEVYTGTMVPPQFQPGLSACGSIVIWTK